MGWTDGERERGLRNRQRDDRRGRPVTEDGRVKEKEGISFPARDENPEVGGREEEEQDDDREEQESVTEKENNQCFCFFFCFCYSTSLLKWKFFHEQVDDDLIKSTNGVFAHQKFRHFLSWQQTHNCINKQQPTSGRSCYSKCCFTVTFTWTFYWTACHYCYQVHLCFSCSDTPKCLLCNQPINTEQQKILIIYRTAGCWCSGIILLCSKNQTIVSKMPSLCIWQLNTAQSCDSCSPFKKAVHLVIHYSSLATPSTISDPPALRALSPLLITAS